MDLFWHWGRETLVPNLYPGVLYNNKSDKYTGFVSDRNNYLVGISRLRQARVQKGGRISVFSKKFMGNSNRVLFMILSYSSRGSVLTQKLAYISIEERIAIALLPILTLFSR